MVTGESGGRGRGGRGGRDHELERAASNELSPFSRILFPLQLRPVSAVVNARLFIFLGHVWQMYAIYILFDSQDLCTLGSCDPILKIKNVGCGCVV